VSRRETSGRKRVNGHFSDQDVMGMKKFGTFGKFQELFFESSQFD
jgi:hypothetical protein